MKYTFGTLLSRDFWIAPMLLFYIVDHLLLKKKRKRKKKPLYKVSHPQEQEISDEIDNENTPQELSNLPLAYVWNLKEYKSLDSIEIKI